MKARKKTLLPALVCGLLAALSVPLRAAEPLAKDPDEGATPCDWLSVEGKIGGGAVRLKFEFAGPVDFEKGAAYNVFLDTDQDRTTGFRGANEEFPIGADYLLQGAAVFHYNGTGTDWSWEQADTSDFEIDGKTLSLTVSLGKIGNARGAIDFFCFGDNEAEGVGGQTPDTMPDGAFANGAKLTLKP